MQLPDEYVKVLLDAATEADAAGLLGKCDENMMAAGGCRICTVLEQTSWRLGHQVDIAFPPIDVGGGIDESTG